MDWMGNRPCRGVGCCRVPAPPAFSAPVTPAMATRSTPGVPCPSPCACLHLSAVLQAAVQAVSYSSWLTLAHGGAQNRAVRSGQRAGAAPPPS
jgi:hypothetical protein